MDKKAVKREQTGKILDAIITMHKAKCLTPEEDNYLEKVYVKIFEDIY